MNNTDPLSTCQQLPQILIEDTARPERSPLVTAPIYESALLLYPRGSTHLLGRLIGSDTVNGFVQYEYSQIDRGRWQ